MKFSKKYFITLALLTTINPLIASRTHKNPRHAKQEAWNKMAAEVDKWGDGLGLGIDVGIKETVIVLNLLGLKTSASCQGHINRGVPAPWIDFKIEDPEMNAMQKEFSAFLSELQQRETAIEQKYAGLSKEDVYLKMDEDGLIPLWKKRIEMGNQLERLSRTKMMPLQGVIKSFYKKYGYRSYDRTLLLHYYYQSSFYRLMSIGTDWQVVYDEKVCRQNLKEYQEEMRLFTEFLKDYYFSKTYPVFNK